VRGLLVGRFQPFHSGHLAVVRTLRAEHPSDELILGIGSAQASFTWRDPFTAGERLEMVSGALSEAGISGTLAVPIPDIDRHALWVRYLESLLPRFERVYTNNPLTQLLFDQAGYRVERPALVERQRFEGAQIRAELAGDGDWRARVPASVASYLDRLRAPARLAILREGAERSSAEARP